VKSADELALGIEVVEGAVGVVGVVVEPIQPYGRYLRRSLAQHGYLLFLVGRNRLLGCDEFLKALVGFGHEASPVVWGLGEASRGLRAGSAEMARPGWPMGLDFMGIQGEAGCQG
jgi:hypothetical protein